MRYMKVEVECPKCKCRYLWVEKYLDGNGVEIDFNTLEEIK